MRKIIIANIILLLVSSLSAQVQNKALKKLFESGGLEVKFIYYSTGNGLYHDGINIYLQNDNDFAIHYSFELIFKSGEKQKSTEVSGNLKAGEIKTGSNSNLYFIPFDDGTEIKYIGASKIKVTKQ